MDSVTDATDTAQLLHVDGDQLAGTFSLTPDDRLFRLKALKAREAMASQNASHRGRAQAHSSCDLGARVSALAQPQHFKDPIRVSLSGHPMRPGAAIDQGRLAGLFERKRELDGSTIDRRFCHACK